MTALAGVLGAAMLFMAFGWIQRHAGWRSRCHGCPKEGTSASCNYWGSCTTEETAAPDAAADPQPISIHGAPSPPEVPVP